MTLQEALASGRKFRKVGSTSGYSMPATFVAADISANYEVEPEVGKTLTKSALAAAWDASVPASGSVGKHNESSMFTRLVTRLGL